MIGTILDIFRSHTHTHNMSFSRRRMALAAQIPRSTTRPHSMGRRSHHANSIDPASWQRAPTTHRSIRQAPIADAYTSNATRLKLVLEGTLAALRRRVSKPRLPCTNVHDGDDHDCRKKPADGVHRAEKKSPSPLTVKLLWQ